PGRRRLAAARIAVFDTPDQAVGGFMQLVEYRRNQDALMQTPPTLAAEIRPDAARGRAIVVNRQIGLCLLCHNGPFPEERFQGTLAPDLKGTGARFTEGQLRLRVVDASKANAATIMPPYYRTHDLTRVAAAFRGKPILTAEQIEDVVAFLTTLQ
ncbi:MAG: sulfur oxidation c-type cytochrome SoxX, partial [Sphingomicrobium sp.]